MTWRIVKKQKIYMQINYQFHARHMASKLYWANLW